MQIDETSAGVTYNRCSVNQTLLRPSPSARTSAAWPG